MCTAYLAVGFGVGEQAPTEDWEMEAQQQERILEPPWAIPQIGLGWTLEVKTVQEYAEVRATVGAINCTDD